MNTLFFFIFSSIIVIAIIMKFFLKSEKLLYKKKEFLLSASERSFFGVLEKSVGNDFKIFCKVRIADVIGIEATKNKKAWWSAFGKISQKHFDYVICSNTDYSIKGVIELNDKSHQKTERKSRDIFVSEICKTSELPLIMIPAKKSYVIGDIQSIIMSSLNIQPPPLQIVKSHHPQKKSENICPKCNASMILRKTKNGINEGKEFWGCSQFPKCREILTQGEIL